MCPTAQMTHPLLADFAARLVAAMTEKGVKNPDVAEAVGVVPNTVSKWRQRLQKPSEEQMERLAAYLEKTESWLRYGDAPRAVNETARLYDAGKPGVYPPATREYLAELRLRLVRVGATDEQIDEAFDLFKAQEVFAFFVGGTAQPFGEEDILSNVKTFAEEVVIPTLKRRGLKL